MNSLPLFSEYVFTRFELWRSRKIFAKLSQYVIISDTFIQSPSVHGAKKKSARPQRVSQAKAIAQPPVRLDDLKMISGVGPGLEKKLQDIGFVSYSQIAALTEAEITELEAHVIKFAGRIKRDDWIGQATQLMAQ